MFGLVRSSTYRKLQQKYDAEVVERRLVEIQNRHLASELEWCRKAIEFMRQLTGAKGSPPGPRLVKSS